MEEKKRPPKVLNKFKKESFVRFSEKKLEKKNTNTKIVRFISNYWKKILFAVIALAIAWIFFADDNSSLTKFPSELTNPKTITFGWEYNGFEYSITETLYESVYEYYNLNPEKEFYYGDMDENDYFINFLSKSEALEDDTISKIVQEIRLEANKRNLSDDELVELIIAFVQFIPYDDDKLAIIEYGNEAENEKTWPRFPYEVLYENKGVCSGKTLLTIALLKEIGYGATIFDFDNEMHMAPAVKCTKEYSSYNSGYCFAEVTETGYKIGEIPQLEIGVGKPKSRSLMDIFSNGQKERIQNLLGLKDVEILGATDGKSYERITETAQTIRRTKDLEAELNGLVNIIDSAEREMIQSENTVDYYDGQSEAAYRRYEIWQSNASYNEYRRLYSKYESAYLQYRSKLNEYNRNINEYNKLTEEYNALIEDFYK